MGDVEDGKTAAEGTGNNGAAGAGSAAAATGADNNFLGDGGAEPIEVPEKFRVMGADGKTLDAEATLRKLTGSYVSLEKRIGEVELPPEKEDGYKLDYTKFPQGTKIDQDGEKAFLKRMHGKGLSNKQVQEVVDYYGELLTATTTARVTQAQNTVGEVVTALKTAWGDTADARFKDVQTAFAALADTSIKEKVKEIGFNPQVTYHALMSILAKIGEGMREDTTPHGEDGGEAETIEGLRKSEAYWNANHPDHKKTKERVNAYYQRKYPAKKG